MEVSAKQLEEYLAERQRIEDLVAKNNEERLRYFNSLPPLSPEEFQKIFRERYEARERRSKTNSD